MNNNLYKILLLAAIVILSVFVGTRISPLASKGTLGFGNSAPKNKLTTAMEYISQLYVDTVSMDELVEKAIPSVLEELDPHSTYISAADLQSSNEPLEGNFDGIGVTFNMPNDTVIVINVIPSGPSDKAGVHPGDRIINVNAQCIAGNKIGQDSVMKLLRGKSGSKVQIEVKREGEQSLVPIKITRGKIPIKSVDVAYMITPETGYIRMTKFARTTHEEFMEAVKNLHSQGMKNMILDLRDNTGGLLDQAFSITNEFFSDKRMIVYTEGRASKRQNMFSKGNGKCNDKLIILIDEGSASASEILAGAIQDNDRGLIIGRRSFGKGLVQQPVLLPDKSCIRLTIARYYTPSGRSIQRPYEHGRSGSDSYYQDIYRRYQSGELQTADSIHQNDTTKYFTTNGRVVYGGGGITPDIFVPYDTVNSYMVSLRRKNVIYDYALSFGDKYRNKLLEIKTIEDLDRFYASYNPMSGFQSFAQSKGINGTAIEINEAEKWIMGTVKAYVGRTTSLDDIGASYYLNMMDNTVKQALENINTEIK